MTWFFYVKIYFSFCNSIYMSVHSDLGNVIAMAAEKEFIENKFPS